MEYRAQLIDGSVEVVDNPSSMPLPQQVESIEEPFVTVTILSPTDYVGTLMELAQGRRGQMQKMEYLSEDRVELVDPPDREQIALLAPAFSDGADRRAADSPPGSLLIPFAQFSDQR